MIIVESASQGKFSKVFLDAIKDNSEDDLNAIFHCDICDRDDVTFIVYSDDLTKKVRVSRQLMKFRFRLVCSKECAEMAILQIADEEYPLLGHTNDRHLW